VTSKEQVVIIIKNPSYIVFNFLKGDVILSQQLKVKSSKQIFFHIKIYSYKTKEIFIQKKT